MPINYITNLKLYNFRNYVNFEQNFGRNSVIIIGPNGAGKTNILESISLFSPGKAIRNNNIDDFINKNTNNHHWKIEAILEDLEQIHELKIWSSYNEEKKYQKNLLFDSCKMNNFSELTEYLNIIWLTPQMDQLIPGPASDRRKFFDRIVASFYPDHIKNLSIYDKMLKERANILKISYSEDNWLDSVEEKIVEYGIIIAASRLEIANFVQEMIYKSKDKFPHAIIKLENIIENMIEIRPSIEVEAYFRQMLRDNRQNDFITGRTNAGIHKTDLVLFHKEKNIEAFFCSTGEQKSLLVNMILAQSLGLIIRKNIIPILLLDEIVAHLDSERRKELFLRINNLNIQSWMTGTEEESFKYMRNNGRFYELENGNLKEMELII